MVFAADRFTVLPAVVVVISVLAGALFVFFERPSRGIKAGSAATAAWVSALILPFFFLLGWKIDWKKHFFMQEAYARGDLPEVLEGLTLVFYGGLYVLPGLVERYGLLDGQIAIRLFSTLSLYIAFWGLLVAFYGWRPRKGIVMLGFLFCMLASSGLDAVGHVIINGFVNPQSLEWWAGIAQISSTYTLIIWVPQHITPALILVALLYRQASPAVLALAMVGCAFWSPFVFVGAAPLVAMYCGTQMRQRGSLRVFGHLLWAVPILLVLYFYYTAGDRTAVVSFSWKGTEVTDWLRRYIFLIALEVAPFYLFARVLGSGPRYNLDVAFATILALILFRYGVWNDLAMRGILVPQLYLISAAMFTLVDKVTAFPPIRGLGQWAFVLAAAVFLFLGMLTALDETRFSKFRAYNGADFIAEDLTSPDIQNQYFFPKDALSGILR